MLPHLTVTSIVLAYSFIAFKFCFIGASKNYTGDF